MGVFLFVPARPPGASAHGFGARAGLKFTRVEHIRTKKFVKSLISGALRGILYKTMSSLTCFLFFPSLTFINSPRAVRCRCFPF